MKIFGEVCLAQVQQHELATECNARLGDYEMDSHCPLSQCRCFQVILESSDHGRLYLLGLTEFFDQTKDRTARLQDVLPSARNLPRVASFINDGIDLRTRSGLDLILVAADLQSAALVATDGNHRSMAQFLVHKSMDCVPAFVCINPSIEKWKFFPPQARSSSGKSLRFVEKELFQMTKETKYAGSFVAVDEENNDYTISKWTDFHILHDRGGTHRVEGNTTLKTDDGTHVNRIEKGRYRILGMQFDLTSSDPAAP